MSSTICTHSLLRYSWSRSHYTWLPKTIQGQDANIVFIYHGITGVQLVPGECTLNAAGFGYFEPVLLF